MKMLVLYRERSEHRQKIEDFIRDFKSRHNKLRVEIYDVDRREGMAMASIYDVMRYPAILALRDDGSILQTWEGEDNLPRLDEVSYFALDQS